MHIGMTECHISFLGTVTLTSDLVLRIVVYGAYPLGIPNLVWMHLGMAECCIPFSGHCDLDL